MAGLGFASFPARVDSWSGSSIGATSGDVHLVVDGSTARLEGSRSLSLTIAGVTFVAGVFWTPTRVALGANNGRIVLWDIEEDTNSDLRSSSGSGLVVRFAVDSSSRLVMVIGSIVYRANLAEEIETVIGMAPSVASAIIEWADDQYLISLAGTLRIIDTTTPGDYELVSIGESTSFGTMAKFIKVDDHTVLARTTANQLRRITISEALEPTTEWTVTPVNDMVVKDTFIVGISSARGVHIRSLSTGAVLWTMEILEQPLQIFAWPGWQILVVSAARAEVFNLRAQQVAFVSSFWRSLLGVGSSRIGSTRLLPPTSRLARTSPVPRGSIREVIHQALIAQRPGRVLDGRNE